jgi:hypothetical protein
MRIVQTATEALLTKIITLAQQHKVHEIAKNKKVSLYYEKGMKNTGNSDIGYDRIFLIWFIMY